jgi:N-acetylneuraminate synthase
MNLGGRPVGREHPPYVVAELSGNHDGRLERALAIVDAAAAAGADAVKLQTYTADTMTLDLSSGDFVIDDPTSLWHRRTLHDLYCEASTPWEWHEPLFARCRALGLACFSTPFDESAVDFLETLAPPAYKIASFEMTDLPLIARVARTGRPLIVSTGMATVAEIDEAVRTARTAGCRDLILLKCTSSYPANPIDTNLATIPHMRELFGVEVGLSDHTGGIGAAVASVALGAVLIEKHVTLSRAGGGVDAAFSIEPDELGRLVTETERAWQARGEVRYGPTAGDAGSVRFRRSLYVAEDMRAGDAFTASNLRIIRPGLGLPPKYYEVVMGKRIAVDAPRGTALSWELLGEPKT